MFQQSEKVEDYIFPLVRARKFREGGFMYDRQIGTAFFIGSRGYALTAAHVIEQAFDDKAPNEVVLAFFWDGTDWHIEEITQREKHPTEDVGIIKVPGEGWRSIVALKVQPQYASTQYATWGYPFEAAREARQLYENIVAHIELVYTQGYVRRRISRELFPSMIFRGRQFYELSEQVGAGNSGAPLILRDAAAGQRWQCFGIYIGEKERGTVSYGVRAEAFVSWVPPMLGRTIEAEGNE